MTTYTIAGLTAFDKANHPDTCMVCGRESLKHAVKVVGNGEVLWVGTGCAANLVLGATDKIAKAEAKRMAKEAQDVVDTAEALERKARADAEHAAWKSYLDNAAGEGDTFDQIQRLGGFAAARAGYRA